MLGLLNPVLAILGGLHAKRPVVFYMLVVVLAAILMFLVFGQIVKIGEKRARHQQELVASRQATLRAA